MPKLNEILEFNTRNLRVASREGKHREFKAGFSKPDFSKYTKTLAAFCNTNGGSLIFGVAENPRRIEGISIETFPDEADWADRLRSDFEPDIPFKIEEHEISGRWIAIVHVEKHSYGPVIARRNMTMPVEKKGRTQEHVILQDGAIYYRQTGQTRLISYPELQTILNERESRRLRAFLESVEIINKIGADRVGIVDATKASAPGQNTTLYVSRETAKSLNFIEKGRFVEANEEGSPAFIVAGTVQLKEVVERIIDDGEKNLPSEAAKMIEPLIMELFGKTIKFGDSHLAKLSNFLKIRNGEDTDRRFCIYDKKIKRFFYTNDGIAHIKLCIKKDPNGCLAAFASKKAIETLGRN